MNKPNEPAFPQEKTMRPLLFPAFLAATLGLTACAPKPDYLRPEVATPEAFKEALPWKKADSADKLPEAPWWRAFGDAQLEQLLAQLAIDNQNLKASEAQYRAAQATLEGARAGLFPAATLAASASRSASAASGGVSPPANTAYSVSASLGWEVDVWGRIRRNVDSADARLQASAADLAAARLSAQALLAQTYVLLRAAQAQIQLLQRTTDAYRRFLELTRNRLAVGVASSLEVAQAETQWANAQAQAMSSENLRSQLEHAIAVLVGLPPSALSLPAGGRLPDVPATPALLPSQLLESRPDIAAAERRMAAANAQIGVAEAAFFPVLNLSATPGQRSSELASLFTAPARFWSIGPALALSLFDGGSRAAAVEQAGAAYDQTVAAYRQTVLQAFQEVEDNLAAARWLAQESEAQASALAAARRAREIAENQYRAGISSALVVVVAQTAELGAEIASLGLASRRLQAAIQLYKNTGGQNLPPR